MPYMPDDDEGEIRLSLIDAMAVMALALLVIPGVIWWGGTLIDAGQAAREALR
jgi:hypothetical protein